MIDCQADPVGAARRLADAFASGGRLVVMAPTMPDHGRHVAVEFLHPAVTGAVALPARFLEQGQPVARPGDVVLVIGDSADRSAAVAEPDLEIPALSDAEIMTCYHLLWELVQLELASADIDEQPNHETLSDDGDSTDFLYPFLDGPVAEAAADLTYSAEAKAAESATVAEQSVAANEQVLGAAASAVSESVARGGTVLTMGNGGSACDAARAARLLNHAGVAAESLASDYAVVTALGNDLGAQNVFSRQLEALGRPGDILVGFSTSGTSSNLLSAFDQAKSVGMVTIGFAGYNGTGFAAHPSVDHTVAVGSQSVHRIQEAQAVLLDIMINRIITDHVTTDHITKDHSDE